MSALGNRLFLACGAAVLIAGPGTAFCQQRNLSVSATDQRVALVIGNAAYQGSPLRNPVNDARAMAERLAKLGFTVIKRENMKAREIGAALREFRSRLSPGATALFFYAGHGLQLKGQNYLPAIDADIDAEEDVSRQSLNVSEVLELMEEAKSKVNLVFLDACRNNPFMRRFRSAAQGLAKVDAASGTLISFATRPGSVAADGAGQNGLYTEHLLKHMEEPGLPVEQMLKRVGSGVKLASSGRQEPWSEGLIEGDFFFRAAPPPVAVVTPPPAPVPPPAPTPAASAPDVALTTELAFWDSIKASSQPGEYQAYLEQFPNGRFVSLARMRMEALKRQAQPAPAPAPAAPQPAPAQVASAAPSLAPVATGSRLPVVGEKWVYRYTDEWKPSDKVQITHTVSGVNGNEVTERLSASIGGRTATNELISGAGADLRGWTLGKISMREFSPYASAFDLVKSGARLGAVRQIDVPELGIDMPVSGSIEGEEEVTVPAGRYRATRVVITGSRASSTDSGVLSRFEMNIWYAQQVKRAIKMTFVSYASSGRAMQSQLHRDVYELVSAGQ